MPSEIRSFKSRFNFLKGTIFHPQWIAHRIENDVFSAIGRQANGLILDIGCADQRIRSRLNDGTIYIGLDYYVTAKNWYGTLPTIFGDAHCLPFATESTDSIFLLDVLEHLEQPTVCIHEISRCLKPGGRLFLKVPFLYPLHDVPRDFGRWTEYGIAEISKRHNFRVVDAAVFGHPVETAAMLMNVSLSKTTLNWLASRNPLAIAGLLLPAAVVLLNIFGWLVAKLSRPDRLMPHSYVFVLEKQAAL